MADPASRILNPLLGLIALYKKDNKSFKDVTNAISGRMNELGITLTDEYITEKVLPWVLSFLYMTTAQQLMDEYIQALSSTAPGTQGPAAAPKPANKPAY